MTRDTCSDFDNRFIAYYERGDTYPRIAILMGTPQGSIPAIVRRLANAGLIKLRRKPMDFHRPSANALTDGAYVRHFVSRPPAIRPDVSAFAFPDPDLAKRRLMGSR